jgi:hypothetical protein
LIFGFYQFYPIIQKMNNTTMMMNATVVTGEVNQIAFLFMGGLLILIPVLCGICCFMSVVNKYIYNYGEYTDNAIDDTEKQSKIRGIYESLFGSISSPKLTKIIVVTIAFENQNPIP